MYFKIFLCFVRKRIEPKRGVWEREGERGSRNTSRHLTIFQTMKMAKTRPNGIGCPSAILCKPGVHRNTNRNNVVFFSKLSEPKYGKKKWRQLLEMPEQEKARGKVQPHNFYIKWGGMLKKRRNPMESRWTINTSTDLIHRWHHANRYNCKILGYKPEISCIAMKKKRKPPTEKK